MPDAVMLWVNLWVQSAQMLAVFAVIFTLLAKIMPRNPDQPILRNDLLTDIAYFFFSPFFFNIGRVALIGVFSWVLHGLFSDDTLAGYLSTGFGPASTLGVWQQAAIVFILSDILLYWLHRWFHSRRMWRLHAVHHCSKHLDFLSTHRFHFVNLWLSFVLVDVLILSLGFSPEAIACMATFNALYSAMVHANLNWTFGPFKYFFASPVFHRWHHTTQKEGLNKNFAPTFPLLDIMFGTFYMPDGLLPKKFGLLGPQVPDGFFKQMDWPFKQKS